VEARYVRGRPMAARNLAQVAIVPVLLGRDGKPERDFA
jgi:hypothetical protein